MTASALTAATDGPALQQQVLAFVPSAPSPHGDYAVQVGVTHLLPGAASDDLCHAVPEAVVVVAGELEMWTDGSRSTIGAGDHFVIETGAWHRFANVSTGVATMLFAFGGDPDLVTTRRKSQPDEEGTR